MDLLEATNRFYYEMSLGELRQMHANLHFPNITYNSLLYLDLIAYKKNCTVSYLADALHIAKSSVTSKINELIKLGLVEKKQSQHDKRVYHLSVSSETAKQYKAYNRAFHYAVKRMEQTYSSKDIALFCNMMICFSEYYVEGIDYD